MVHPITRSGGLPSASDFTAPFPIHPLVREAAVEYGGSPGPFTDADALEEIEEQVVTLAAHIHAATRRLLSLIAEFDRRRGWELGGHRSCAHWLAFRTARALEGLPEIGASMARGELSFSKVRALIRVAAETLRPVEDLEKAAAQRRAAALELVVERALAAGFADGPLSGSRAGRYQVMAHVDEGGLREDGSADRCELEDGTRVVAETSRRLACDCGVVRVEHGSDTEILNVGRRTRTISPALRRALEVRDRGCRFPGCESRNCDAHHVRHWAEGGETSLANCLLLYHHRLVHEEGWTVEWWGPGRPAFRSPRGWIEFEGGWREPGSRGRNPGGGSSGGQNDVSAETSGLDRGGAKRSEWVSRETAERSGGETSGRAAQRSERVAGGGNANPATALVQANEALDVIPDGWTPSARWKREWAIPEGVLGRVGEAILEGMKGTPRTLRGPAATVGMWARRTGGDTNGGSGGIRG